MEPLKPFKNRTDDGGPMKRPVPAVPNPDMYLWPRIQQAINAATVSRGDVLVNLPSCHRKNCHGDHGDIDLVFRMFAKAISDSIRVELLCKAISEPDDGGVQ